MQLEAQRRELALLARSLALDLLEPGPQAGILRLGGSQLGGEGGILLRQ